MVAQIGAFRSWILEKIEHVKKTFDTAYVAGYNRAMVDVARYHDFPLDEKEWEKW